MEFVHHHVVYASQRTHAERQVRHDLGRATDDGSLPVHGAIAGNHAHLIGAEKRAKIPELFIYQRLDRASIERTPTLRERLKVKRERNQRFS